jgi:hypothetical protein
VPLPPQPGGTGTASAVARNDTRRTTPRPDHSAMLGHNDQPVVRWGSILSTTWIRRKDTLMTDIREFR